MSAATVTDITPDDWQQRVNSAINRGPIETTIVVRSHAAQKATAEARQDLAEARSEATRKAFAKNPEIDGDDLEAAIVKVAAVKRAAKALDDAEANEAAQELPILLRSLEPYEYEELQLEHPATDEQQVQGKIWNDTTFWPALLAACSVRPLTPDQAAGILKGGNAGDAGQMMMTLRNLNERGTITLGKGSRPIPS